MENIETDLFKKQTFIMHSGGVSKYKIECDALSDESIETLAFLISEKGKFSEVYGVPRGGIRIANALMKYRTPGKGPKLIVDDVLTTGRSMEEAKLRLGWHNAIGVVIFARNTYPKWIKPIFEMNWINTEDTFYE